MNGLIDALVVVFFAWRGGLVSRYTLDWHQLDVHAPNMRMLLLLLFVTPFFFFFFFPPCVRPWRGVRLASFLSSLSPPHGPTRPTQGTRNARYTQDR